MLATATTVVTADVPASFYSSSEVLLFLPLIPLMFMIALIIMQPFVRRWGGPTAKKFYLASGIFIMLSSVVGMSVGVAGQEAPAVNMVAGENTDGTVSVSDDDGGDVYADVLPMQFSSPSYDEAFESVFNDHEELTYSVLERGYGADDADTENTGADVDSSWLRDFFASRSLVTESQEYVDLVRVHNGHDVSELFVVRTQPDGTVSFEQKERQQALDVDPEDNTVSIVDVDGSTE